MNTLFALLVALCLVPFLGLAVLGLGAWVVSWFWKPKDKDGNPTNPRFYRWMQNGWMPALIGVVVLCMVAAYSVLYPVGASLANQYVPSPTGNTVETPAANVPSGGSSVSHGSVCEMTTAKAKQILGVDVQRLGTEDCAWVYRVPGGGSTFTANLPDLWVATITETNGKVVVYDGESNLDITGWAATYRYAPGYSANDAVNVPCEILAKEQAFGASEVPSFKVSAGNFTCR